MLKPTGYSFYQHFIVVDLEGTVLWGLAMGE